VDRGVCLEAWVAELQSLLLIEAGAEEFLESCHLTRIWFPVYT